MSKVSPCSLGFSIDEIDSDLVRRTIYCKNDISDERLGESNSLDQSFETDSSRKGKPINLTARGARSQC